MLNALKGNCPKCSNTLALCYLILPDQYKQPGQRGSEKFTSNLTEEGEENFELSSLTCTTHVSVSQASPE